PDLEMASPSPVPSPISRGYSFNQRAYWFHPVGDPRTAGFSSMGGLASFGLPIPLRLTIELAPVVFAATGAPVAPAGLGPMQASTASLFSAYAPADRVLAAGLAFGVVHLLFRLPLAWVPRTHLWISSPILM